MVKNAHLLMGIAAASVLSALFCAFLVLAENRNGHSIAKAADDFGKKIDGLENGKIERLYTRLGELDGSIQRIKGEELRDLKQSLEKTQTEITTLTTSNSQLQKELTTKNAELKGLQQEIGTLKKRLEKLESGDSGKGDAK